MQADLHVFALGAGDINEIMALERKVCIPPIQASASTILHRLMHGNVMLGVEHEGSLVGTIGFRYGNFSPDDFRSFPTTFWQFSTPAVKPPSFNAGFVYSVNVHPDHRTLAVHAEKSADKRIAGIGKTLMVSAVQRMATEGCTYAVGDGRPASYRGSSDFPQEHYKQDLHLKELLEGCTSGQAVPSEVASELLATPVFAAYDKSLGGGVQVAWVIPDFFPSDIPSGGYRVILYKELYKQLQ